MNDQCHEKAIRNKSQGFWQLIKDIKLFSSTHVTWQQKGYYVYGY